MKQHTTKYTPDTTRPFDPYEYERLHDHTNKAHGYLNTVLFIVVGLIIGFVLAQMQPLEKLVHEIRTHTEAP